MVDTSQLIRNSAASQRKRECFHSETQSSCLALEATHFICSARHEIKDPQMFFEVSMTSMTVAR